MLQTKPAFSNLIFNNVTDRPTSMLICQIGRREFGIFQDVYFDNVTEVSCAEGQVCSVARFDYFTASEKSNLFVSYRFALV